MSKPLRGPLPLMKSIEDAVALCHKEQDNFYVTAFMIEAWLGSLILDTVAEYAEKKSAVDRRLQTGRARQLFEEIFGHVGDEEFPHLFLAFCRFGEYDDPQSETLLRAFALLSFEEPPPESLPSNPTREVILALVAAGRRRVARLCDWIEAIVHWQVHEFSYLSPVSFDPDPQKRELAALGVNQRCFAHLDDFGKAWWFWHHGEAAEEFKNSPKWSVLGQAMASEKTRTQKYPQLDEVVIACWPVVKKHNWTYRDLLNLLLAVLPTKDAYPLQREHDLATYCNNVLGLRKQTGDGSTAKDGKPTGFDVALRICTVDPS